ncbi:LacI family DNA-binding transcriptional regulator [Aerococcus christensenii]|uniref:LacI family DNA-binding transcriptional regulator n=1 Tax=Aerococcus christensenii TaxID=87541 RepID=UPI003F430F37
MKKISIKDIAELSGYSIATVSRVINKKGKYSKRTEEKILKIIDETDYHPNYSAKSLRGNQSYTIGVLIPDITNSFFSSLVQEIEKSLFNAGYSTIITSTNRNKEKETQYINTLLAKNVDGLIIISEEKNFDISEYPLLQETPFICIDRRPSHNTPASLISSDHFQGAYEATKALLDKNVTHPVILVYDKDNPSAIDRIGGFNQAISDNNLPFYRDQVYELGYKSTDEITKAIRYIIAKNNIDGIFAINDDIAALSISIAKNLNVSIPKELKIIGFDNSNFCNYTSPTLSSVKQDTSSIAKKSVSQLIKEIANPSAKKKKILVPTELFIRDSI